MMVFTPRTRLRGPTLVLLGAFACTRQGFLPTPEAGEETQAIGSFASDTHFLLEPTGEAESLLGRAVQVSTRGAWTIADARAPGCEVRVRRAQARYKKRHRVGLGDLTAFSAGYTELLSLEARYGRAVEAEFEIENHETLTADTTGPCGDVIVKSVRVGSGFRRLVRKADAGARARAGQGPVGFEAGRGAASEALDSMEWSDPQAYAFSYDRVAPNERFDFALKLPARFVDGERVRFAVETNDAAYLIVVVLEESGEGGVLYPSNDVPEPRVEAGNPLVLPGPGEPQLEAVLRDPSQPAHETLVVYAFTHREDFERVRPQSLGGDGVTYAARITAALADVPISRWARATAAYEIVPKEARP